MSSDEQGNMSEQSVWVKVIQKTGGDNYEDLGDPFQIVPRPANVSHLREKVKEKAANNLAHVDANELLVFAPDKDYENDKNKMNPWDAVEEIKTRYSYFLLLPSISIVDSRCLFLGVLPKRIYITDHRVDFLSDDLAVCASPAAIVQRQECLSYVCCDTSFQLRVIGRATHHDEMENASLVFTKT